MSDTEINIDNLPKLIYPRIENQLFSCMFTSQTELFERYYRKGDKHAEWILQIKTQSSNVMPKHILKDFFYKSIRTTIG